MSSTTKANKPAQRNAKIAKIKTNPSDEIPKVEAKALAYVQLPNFELEDTFFQVENPRDLKTLGALVTPAIAKVALAVIGYTRLTTPAARDVLYREYQLFHNEDKAVVHEIVYRFHNRMDSFTSIWTILMHIRPEKQQQRNYRVVQCGARVDVFTSDCVPYATYDDDCDGSDDTDGGEIIDLDHLMYDPTSPPQPVEADADAPGSDDKNDAPQTPPVPVEPTYDTDKVFDWVHSKTEMYGTVAVGKPGARTLAIDMIEALEHDNEEFIRQAGKKGFIILTVLQMSSYFATRLCYKTDTTGMGRWEYANGANNKKAINYRPLSPQIILGYMENQPSMTREELTSFLWDTLISDNKWSLVLSRLRKEDNAVTHWAVNSWQKKAPVTFNAYPVLRTRVKGLSVSTLAFRRVHTCRSLINRRTGDMSRYAHPSLQWAPESGEGHACDMVTDMDDFFLYDETNCIVLSNCKNIALVANHVVNKCNIFSKPMLVIILMDSANERPPHGVTYEMTNTGRFLVKEVKGACVWRTPSVPDFSEELVSVRVRLHFKNALCPVNEGGDCTAEDSQMDRILNDCDKYLIVAAANQHPQCQTAPSPAFLSTRSWNGALVYSNVIRRTKIPDEKTRYVLIGNAADSAAVYKFTQVAFRGMLVDGVFHGVGDVNEFLFAVKGKTKLTNEIEIGASTEDVLSRYGLSDGEEEIDLDF